MSRDTGVNATRVAGFDPDEMIVALIGEADREHADHLTAALLRNAAQMISAYALRETLRSSNDDQLRRVLNIELNVTDEQVETAARAWCLAWDIDPDYPHGGKPNAEAWWKVEAPSLRAALESLTNPRSG